MANNQVQPKNQQIEQVPSVSSLIASPSYKRKFQDVLGKKAPGFIASIISASKNDLSKCDSNSTLSAAMIAATLDLPINQNLGFAYLIPYWSSKEKKFITQFQMGYKGFIQLAIRSGQYKTINAIEVYENEILRQNRLTGEIELNQDESMINKDHVIGYMGYFRLLNGFEKVFYMSVDDVEKHAKTYSQSYSSEKDWVVKGSMWTTNFDSMAKKTVLKQLISKYGIMSIEMQTAIESDQAYIDENNNPVYVDNQVAEEIKENANKTVLTIEEPTPAAEYQYKEKSSSKVKEKEPVAMQVPVDEIIQQSTFAEDEECPF